MDDLMQLKWIYINIHLFVSKDESWKISLFRQIVIVHGVHLWLNNLKWQGFFFNFVM
jgi:hypothetical protein